MLAAPSSHEGETWGYINIDQEGIHTVNVTLVDNAGNVFENSYIVKLDTVSPGVPILLSPTDNSYSQISSMNFDWSDSDDLYNNPVSYEISWSKDMSFNSDVSVDTPTLPEISVPNSFDEGTWYWRVRSLDALMNYSGYSQVNSFTIDWTAPVITMRGSKEVTVTQGNIFTDSGAITDDGSTVTVSGTVDTSRIGTYTITYSSVDAAGNVAKSMERTVAVVKVLPQSNTDEVAAANPGGVTDTDGQVLGATTTDTTEDSTKDKTKNDNGEVKGTSDTKKQNSAENRDFLGLAWYWWLLVIVLAGLAVWWIVSIARRRIEE